LEPFWLQPGFPVFHRPVAEAGFVANNKNLLSASFQFWVTRLARTCDLTRSIASFRYFLGIWALLAGSAMNFTVTGFAYQGRWISLLGFWVIAFAGF